MSRHIRIEGWVLKKKSLSNQDKVITLFTHEFGKIVVFAKGVKKITSRRLPHLETGNLIKALVNQKDHRFYLNQTTLRSGFTSIKDNEIKTSFLYFFLFILERLLPENQPEPEIYNLTKKFFVELSHGSVMKRERLTWYLNQILLSLGYTDKELPFHEAVMQISEIANENLPTLI